MREPGGLLEDRDCLPLQRMEKECTGNLAMATVASDSLGAHHKDHGSMENLNLLSKQRTRKKKLIYSLISSILAWELSLTGAAEAVPRDAVKKYMDSLSVLFCASDELCFGASSLDAMCF